MILYLCMQIFPNHNFICFPPSVNVHISHWKSSEVSDCRRFAEYVADSMEEMATLLGYEGELEMPKVVRK